MGILVVCTIAILIDVVDDTPLAIAANRDELYARPTRPAERLAVDRGLPIVGGVDEQSGGTWLAVRADARFAAVTNQRALVTQPPGLRSRGHVVRDLVRAPDPEAYLRALDAGAYASMNLVFGEPGRVFVAYVRREERTIDIAELAPGVHVLCNDRLNTPGFPRGERLQAAIVDALVADTRWPTVAARITTALGDHALAEGPPPSLSHLPLELEHQLTATCIHTPLYGTRSASLVALAPGRVLDYRYADGPPCTAPFLDRRALFAEVG